MKKNVIFIILLLITSLFLVFFQFDKIPQGLAHDENELARTAFSLENKPYTPFISVADGHGTPYFYILLSSFKTFGINKFALRLPNKIFGVFIVIIFYFLMRSLFHSQKKWGGSISFTLSLILLTSRWYLHFVRFSFEMPFLLLLELISLYGIVLYQKNKKILFLIISGIFAGIAFNSYQPGRIFFSRSFISIVRIQRSLETVFCLSFDICHYDYSDYFISYPSSSK